MTTFEILREEANVTDTITLHHEGMFWRAYERSAYLFCTQIKELKITKKEYKMMYGTTLVYIGFPEKSLEKFMGRFRLISQGEKTLTYGGFQPLDKDEFDLWRDNAGFDLRKSPLPPRIKPHVLMEEMPDQVGHDVKTKVGHDVKTQAGHDGTLSVTKHYRHDQPHPTVMADLIGHLDNKGKMPYFEVPVFRTVRDLYSKMIDDKKLESIKKVIKKRMVEPALQDLWDIQVDIFEVRELEKQIAQDNEALHAEARRLLLGARRKAARVIITIRVIYETKVQAEDLGTLIPENLYEDYSHDLISIYTQLGNWIKKNHAWK